MLVDGQVRRTWAGEELAAKQFTDRQPKGGFRQMINLTDALPLEGLGVSRESLVAVVIQGGGRSLELKGAAIEHLESLRLQIDSDKGGAWKLVAKGPDEERVLGPLVGVKRVVIQGVRRIELLTGASLPPKS